GSVPAGLTLTPSTDQLAITGTPTASGTFSFDVTATDTAGATGMRSYTLTINPAVRLSPASVPGGTAGVAYNQVITACDGPGTNPLAAVPTSGSVPAGLTFTPSDNQLAIAGMPTASGTFSFDVTATDEVGATVTGSYTFSIDSGPADHLLFVQQPGNTV